MVELVDLVGRNPDSSRQRGQTSRTADPCHPQVRRLPCRVRTGAAGTPSLLGRARLGRNGRPRDTDLPAPICCPTCRQAVPHAHARPPPTRRARRDQEVPFGLNSGGLGGIWDAAEVPMLLSTFEHIARGALLIWWDELDRKPARRAQLRAESRGAGIPHRLATGTVDRSQVLVAITSGHGAVRRAPGLPSLVRTASPEMSMVTASAMATALSPSGWSKRT